MRCTRSVPFFVALVGVWFESDAANWAQVVGIPRQTGTYPVPPAFPSRWGHATVVLDRDSLNEQSSIIVLGGDTVASSYQV